MPPTFRPSFRISLGPPRFFGWSLGSSTCFSGRSRSAGAGSEGPGHSWPALLVVTIVGSLLSFIATLASPGTFIWSRLIDAASSIADRQTLEINARVERWALDEIPLPGKLVHQIIQWLYRENRFCRGTLRVGETLVSPSSLSIPALVVVTMADEVAPLTSGAETLYRRDAGNGCAYHSVPRRGWGWLAASRNTGRTPALAHVWPEIISWIKIHS